MADSIDSTAYEVRRYHEFDDIVYGSFPDFEVASEVMASIAKALLDTKTRNESTLDTISSLYVYDVKTGTSYPIGDVAYDLYQDSFR